MVVVAIIGVLAAIAIPQLDGFRQKARASEARTSLGSVYTSQKAFFYEGNTYNDNLDVVGVKLEGSNRSYSVGFLNVAAAGTPCTSATGVHISAGTACHFYPNVSAGAGAAAILAPGAGCTATGTTFNAGAFGSTTVLSARYDGFSIDEAKALKVEAGGATSTCT